MEEIKYKRVLLKVNGEALAGDRKTGIDADTVGSICDQVKVLADLGVEVGIVVGGGNFWRGKYGHQNGKRTTSDYMGMFCNNNEWVSASRCFRGKGLKTRVQTAIEMRQIAEPYIRRKAVKHLERGRVVIFACGTGNPYFSTDTGAALRAAEINAEVILLAKTIDGVYSSDPKIDKDAIKYDEISYTDILTKESKSDGFNSNSVMP